MSLKDRFDSATDGVNQAKHGLSLASGDAIFKDGNHLILPSIRERDGEERFKVIGSVGGKMLTGVFVWRDDLPRFISVRRSNRGEEEVKKKPITLPADPGDSEDFLVTADAMNRGQRARLVRTTRTRLGLTQAEFAARFRVPVGTLRDWEQARATPPDFAVAYIRVIDAHPEMVTKALA